MPRHSTIALLSGITLCLAMSPLAAQTVYRCGNSYSETPCPGGKSVKVEDNRTPAQKAEATKDFEGAKKSAAEMERERLAEADGQLPEKRFGTRRPTGEKTDAAGKSDSAKGAPRKPVMNYFTAIVPRGDDKSRKAAGK